MKNWVWMPHAGHFILGNKCQFHLATYVGKYIVSTVGELWNEQQVRRIHAEVHDNKWYQENRNKIGDEFDNVYMERFKFEEIGCDRTYETMVFKAKRAKGQCECCKWVIDVMHEVDFRGYNNNKDAYDGHLKLCKKWGKLICK